MNEGDAGEFSAGDILRKAYETIGAHGRKVLPLADNLLRNDPNLQKVMDFFRKSPVGEPLRANFDAALQSEPIRALNRNIADRKEDISRLAQQLFDSNGAEADGAAEKLRIEVQSLRREKDLAYILDNVHSAAAQIVLEDETLRSQFFSNEPCPMYVMSVDIRRSTDLMLKALSAQHFADFITGVCSDLMTVVKRRYGVIDKFTGDGILCFFPEFFSGADAGYLAVEAAERCHERFSEHYRNSRGSFVSLMKDVGLGIGIDYGLCHLVNVAGELTVVGTPAVYACRFASAPAGLTLVNQPAYQEMTRKFGDWISFAETEIQVKREGALLAYRASLTDGQHKTAAPEWALKKMRALGNASD
jgi:class 3 adenylate cyclase